MAEPSFLHINSSAPEPHLPSSTNTDEPACEQLVLRIEQSSAPVPGEQINASTPPPHHAGILNLKLVEPILLHMNSLTPLLSHINNDYPFSPQSNQSTLLPPPKPAYHPSYPPVPPADDEQQAIDTTNKMKTNPQKRLSSAGSLANLLPTGTVLAFQALIPSLSYNGRCHAFNKYLVALVILVCSAVCFFSSFTDSFKNKGKEYYGKVYVGIAYKFNGFYVLNYEDREAEETDEIKKKLKKLGITYRDFLHAFVSVFVFLIFAFSSTEVQGCYFPKSRELEYSLVVYLPLVAGLISGYLFTLFPTTRRGFGYA